MHNCYMHVHGYVYHENAVIIWKTHMHLLMGAILLFCSCVYVCTVPILHIYFSGRGTECCIGKILYNSQDVLGHGSHGTIVFK